ncbi:MAG: hypothetical protein WCA46_18235 [Actinocatenispora sp.]
MLLNNLGGAAEHVTWSSVAIHVDNDDVEFHIAQPDSNSWAATGYLGTHLCTLQAHNIAPSSVQLSRLAAENYPPEPIQSLGR